MSAPGFGGSWNNDTFALVLESAQAWNIPVTVYLERAPRPEDEHLLPTLLNQWRVMGVSRIVINDLQWLPWLKEVVAAGLRLDVGDIVPSLGTARWLFVQGVTRLWLPAWGLDPEYVKSLQSLGFEVSVWGLGALPLAKSVYQLSTPSAISSCETKKVESPFFIWQEQLLGASFEGGRICLLPLLALLPELNVWGIRAQGRSPEALGWDIYCSRQLMADGPLMTVLQSWADLEAEPWLGGPGPALRYPQQAVRWQPKPRWRWAVRSLEPGMFEALIPLQSGESLEWRFAGQQQTLSLPTFVLYDGEQTSRLKPGQCWQWTEPALLAFTHGAGCQVTEAESVDIRPWLAIWA